jgi:cell division septation protein DedD
MKPKPYNRNRRFLFELSRLQMLLSITGALFILTWVFILGVIVGRGYVSDTITRAFNDQIQKLQQEKKVLMEKYLAQERKPDLTQEEILKPKNLDFYDDLPQKDNGGTHLKIPQPALKPMAPPAKAEAQEKNIPKEPEKPKEPLKTAVKVTGKEPSPLPESKVSKETKEAPKKNNGFMVLVGSYRDEATAESSVKRLQEKKYQAFLRTKDIPQKGGKWFRIQMGPFASRDEAEKMVKKLEHDGFQAIPIANN